MNLFVQKQSLVVISSEQQTILNVHEIIELVY